MSDEEYLDIFNGFIINSDICKSSEKRMIIEEALLMRKRTLAKDFLSFIERKKKVRYGKSR